MTFTVYFLFFAVVLCVLANLLLKGFLMRVHPLNSTGNGPGDNKQPADKSIYYYWMVGVLLLQISFIFMYLSMMLMKFPSWLAELYWVLAGVSGIVLGMWSVKKMKRFTVLSQVIIFTGILLLLLQLLSIGITSM